jgi:PEP-CTERM motif-containing protein
MRYLLLVLTTLFAIDVSSARADPIATFHVTDATMFMRPNVSGDNISFEFTGPGVDISGTGGMGCFAWCSGAPIPLGAGIGLTLISIANFDRALVGGINYDPNTEIGVSIPSFFDDSGGLSPITTGFVGMGPTFTAFRMTMPTNGSWDLNFVPATDENGNAAERFVNGTFSASAAAPTPEPGTLTLMLTGSAGAAWISRRRRQSAG